MSDDTVASLPPRSPRMRTFWKTLATVLAVTVFASVLVNLSMPAWPDMTRSPRPSEGRVYRGILNGSDTYMNRREYLLHWVLEDVNFAGVAAFAAIYFFVDPFDYKRRLRPLRPPRPY
jgi:multidrug efflux pump subunit AcrB